MSSSASSKRPSVKSYGQAISSESRRAFAIKIKWRWLLGLVVGIGVFSLLFFVRYRTQSEKLTDAMIERADQLEADGEWLGAANYLFRYLQLRPRDDDVWARLAETYGAKAVTLDEKERGIELLYRALGIVTDPQQVTKLNRDLAELLVEVGRYPEAEARIETLQDEAFSTRIQALARLSKSRSGDASAKDEAFESLEAALKINPGDVELASTAAMMLRTESISSVPTRTEREKRANEIMENMIGEDANQANAQAWLALYFYRISFSLPDHQTCLDKALELGPEDIGIVSAAANQALQDVFRSGNQQVVAEQDEQLSHADELYQRVIRLTPRQSVGYIGLGSVRMLQQKNDEACAVWREGLEKTSDDPVELNRRLATVLLAQGKPEEAEKVIEDLAVAVANLVGRWDLTLSRKQSLLLESRVNFLRAKLALARRQEIEALRLLQGVIQTWEQVAADQGPSSERLEMYSLLAALYNSTGQFDLAAGSGKKAASLALKSPSTQLLAAEAFAAAGDWQSAVDHYGRALEIDKEAISGDVWLGVVRAHLRLQASMPVAARSWQSFQEALEAAQRVKPDEWRLKLIEVDQVMLSEGSEGKQRALQILAAAESGTPDDAALFRQLAVAYQRLGDSQGSNRAARRFVELSESQAAKHLLAAELLALRGDLDKARPQVEKALSLAEGDERRDALGLSNALYRRAGNIKAVREGLLELHRTFPAQRSYLLNLAELDLAQRDFQQLEAWEQQLQQLEGAEGVYWRYYRANRLLLSGSRDEDAIKTAATLNAEIASLRPSWPKTDSLDALVRLSHGDEAGAIDAYQRLIEAGAGDVSSLRILVGLLYRAQRFAEADEYMKRWKSVVDESQNLASLSIAVAMQLDDVAEAVARARETVQRQPDSPMPKVWLAQALEMNDELDEAGEVLKSAARDHAKEARVWAALFSYFVRRNDAKSAEATLASMVKQSDASESERAFLAAQGYELLGKTEQAEKLYRRAVELDPKRLEPRLRLAAQFLTTDPTQAESLLRECLALNAESRPARRMLSIILAARGGQEAWQEAQALMASSPLERLDPIDNRLKAVALARRGGQQNIAEARELLKKLVESADPPAAIDRLLLASLYELEGKPLAADEQFQATMKEYEAEVSHAVTYVNFLLRYNRPSEADAVLDRENVRAALESLGLAGRGQLLLLKARCVAMEGRTEDIRPMIQKWIDTAESGTDQDAQQAEVYNLLAQVYEAVEEYDEAVAWRRKVVSLVPKAYGMLVRQLCLAGRHVEALEVLSSMGQADQDKPGFAPMLVSVMVTGNAPESVFLPIERQLGELLKKHPEDADVLYSLATVHAMQDRNEDAATLLEKANRARPGVVPVLNNLATVLGEIPGRQSEALAYIDEAIAISGQQAALLDTKGTILARMGDSNQAIAVLSQVVSTPNVDPRMVLHLALAYYRSGDERQARAMFQKALEGGVQSQVLTKADKLLLEELADKFGRSALDAAKRRDPTSSLRSGSSRFDASAASLRSLKKESHETLSLLPCLDIHPVGDRDFRSASGSHV